MKDWGEQNPSEQGRIKIGFACSSAYLLYISRYRDAVTSKASLEKAIHRAEKIDAGFGKCVSQARPGWRHPHGLMLTILISLVLSQAW